MDFLAWAFDSGSPVKDFSMVLTGRGAYPWKTMDITLYLKLGLGFSRLFYNGKTNTAFALKLVPGLLFGIPGTNAGIFTELGLNFRRFGSTVKMHALAVNLGLAFRF